MHAVAEGTEVEVLGSVLISEREQIIDKDRHNVEVCEDIHEHITGRIQPIPGIGRRDKASQCSQYLS